jgi:hypothetical protein
VTWADKRGIGIKSHRCRHYLPDTGSLFAVCLQGALAEHHAGGHTPSGEVRSQVVEQGARIIPSSTHPDREPQPIDKSGYAQFVRHHIEDKDEPPPDVIETGFPGS